MKYSEKSYVNKVAMTGHTINDAVLLVAYLVELLKGSRTPGYLAFFAILTVAPVAAEWIIYKKNPNSNLIKHIMGTCYSLLYIFAVFTTNSQFTFVYALPMYMVITLYSDVVYVTAIAVGGLVVNIAYVAYYALTVGYLATEIPDAEIRIACMLLTGFYMIRSTATLKKNNEARLAQLNEEQAKTTTLLNEVLVTSEAMTTGIEETTQKVELLGGAVERIRDAMEEVSTGSNESAEAIQKQMQKTEQIQEHISRVKAATFTIEQDVTGTTEKVETGKQQIDALNEHVDKSMAANREVLEKMQELGEYASRMNTIIETITSIANSTGMLALNASIEAARAGESGRGFAVVANQISGLASQTKSATVNITELIDNINKELFAVSQAVNVVSESNSANAESTKIVLDNFESITGGTENIYTKTKELIATVAELERANGEIVENIQTVSAITEEVSAHANETYESCEENSKMVEQVSEIVQQLSGYADRLKNAK